MRSLAGANLSRTEDNEADVDGQCDMMQLGYHSFMMIFLCGNLCENEIVCIDTADK